MDTPSPVSWIFKPESAGPNLAQHTYLSPNSLNRSPHSSALAQSPLTSQRHTSPMTPRASTIQQPGSPYRAATASPQSSASTARIQSATQSQDLLLPMMPSTEDSKLHATVSGLRFALQETQLQLGHAQHQVDTMQQRCTATDAQAVQLQQQLTNLHADKALLGARLHDGSLDMVKGQLIQQLEQHLAESTQAAAAAGAASQHTSSQVQSLQDQLALQQQAQASERERLSMEAAQSRLLCKARARQVNTLEVQYQAQVERADSVTEEMQSAREEAARSISDSMLQQDAAMKQAQEAREASQQAHHQLQKAQHAQLAAEQQRQQAEASLRDVRLHMDWQETRIADLESQDIAQTARRYDSELQSMKQQLQQDRQRLEAQLLQEKRAREGAENQLHHTMSLSQSFSPNSSNLGSPRKGRENSSPNKPRGSARLQESVVLRAQFQQSREAAEREAARWKAALEEEQHTSEKLRQQLNQLEESDQLVATAAANSQQQVHHLRQQLESEKTRTAVLDANLQAAAHSVRSSKAFKRRQRSRYTVQDSARMDDGHVDDHSWQHALGLTDNDTGSSAEEDDGDSHMDLGLQPVMVTVGLQTDDVALTALLAGTAGKDSLMTAARQEILRLKDVYSRLLQQRSPGVDSGPVVAEKEAEAAVAAAREAAHHQHEQALQRCNADWTARLDALKAGLQEAKAEAQRVRDCQAQLSRQHQVELQQAKTASEDKAAALQADITHLQERLAAAEADLAAAQARVQQLEQQLQTQQAEAAATEKRMTAQMEQLKMDADTDLAMVMLESSSNASEAASRLGSIRTNAEASKLAAVAELQQQLDAEREHRQQLQQQLLGQSGTPQLQSPVSVAASEEPSQAVAGPKASAQAGAGKDMTLAVVSVRATDDVPKGAEARGQAAEDCTEGTAPAHAEPASSSSRAVDVAVQTDAVLLEQTSSSAPGMPLSPLRSPDSSAASAQPARQTPQQPAKQDAAQQGSDSSPEASGLTADVHEKEEEAQAAQQAMNRSQDAACDAKSDAESASDTGIEPTLQTDAGHSSANSSRSSSSSSGSVRHKNAGRAVRSSTNAVQDSKIGSNPGSVHRRASQSAADRQQDDAVSVQAQDRAVPIEAGVQGQQQKAKGKADGRLSRGLQLPQKLSIASLAKHAGVDKAFMQDWIASVKVPSEEATALSRMADAAAAAAAFTAEGLRDDLHRPSQQAQRAELAKRAQQASDAVLRGDADQGLVQEPDRRSYSRWSGMDAGDDDMCRTSSAVATPESSYATARAVPVSVSHHSVSSGHSSRKGHLPPVYTTSPVIQHRRLHQSSALQSATSPFATALPFSAALPLSPGHRPASPQADTPRFATLGQANPRKSVYESSSHDPHRSSHALEGSAVSYGTSSHALMPSSYSDEPSASASQHHATTREGRALSHADHRASSHTHSGVRASMYPSASSAELSYPQAGSDASPMRRALSRSPRHGAVASSSPYRSPAHAAAVSAVEQHLHTSLHAGSGPFGSSRAVPNSPALLPQPSHGRELSPGRYDGELYQRWTGQTSSPADPRQHSDMQVNTRHAMHAVRTQHGSSAGPESLLMPESQYLHPSPELDSLSQRLREQKLAMSRQGQTGISPLEPEAGYSPGKGYSAYKHAASRIGVQHIHQEGGRTNLSPSRLAGGGPGPEAGRAWSPLPQGQGRSWSALGNDDASSDLQASMYHRERSRLQEALARQHAASAATSIAAGANPLSRSGSPWDSAWDQQSAATRGHSHESHGRRQSNLSSARHQEHSRGVFGSIANDYRLPAMQTSVGSRSERYARN